MELERISVALGPRTAREAVDLGAVLLRTHARAIWLPWFAFSALPAIACMALAAWAHHAWVGMLLLWWLLPLFDRIPLFVLSRAVFERVPGWRETLREQRRMPWGDTIASITWRRLFDSQRSLRLPLALLEGLDRKQRGPRWRVLSRHVGGTASLLTFGCLQLELVLFVSVFMLIALMLPQELVGHPIDELWRMSALPADPSRLMQATQVLVGYLAVSVIEPWYVAAGFGLYLNRRTQLEAWDIELAFRRLRQRLLGGASTLSIAWALCMGMLPVRAEAAAANPPIALQQVFPSVPARDLKTFDEAVTQAFNDARFGKSTKETQWVLRHRDKKDDDPTPTSQTDSLDPRQHELPFVRLIFGGINIVLWILLAVAVALVLWFAWRYLPPVHRASDGGRRRTMTLREEQHLVDSVPTLPSDLAAATLRLWPVGQRREAMSLLYRGSVAQLFEALRETLPEDATEAACLHHARRLDDIARRDRAIAIVRAWQLAAYADRYPSDREMDVLLTGWPAQMRGPT